MSGGPSQHDLWDYKPKMREMFGQDLPEHVRDGQRITGMTSKQKNGLPVVPEQIQVHGKLRRTTTDGVWVSELLPHTATVARQALRRTHHLHRGDQPRPGDHLHPDRQPDPRSSEPGRLAELRPRQHEREPARLRGHARQDQLRRAEPVQPPLGQRLHAVGSPGHPAAQPGRPGALPQQSRPASAAPIAAPSSTHWPRSTRRSTSGSPIPRSCPDQASTRWPTACRPPCPS